MKKFKIYPVLLLVVSIGCSNPNLDDSPLLTEPDESLLAQTSNPRNCGSFVLLEQDIIENPELIQKMEAIEIFTQRAILDDHRVSEPSIITIPVVVHVLYRTSSQNISDDQIMSQIEVLNEDFNLANADKSKIPTIFKSLRSNVGVMFVLDTITRTYSSKRIWTYGHDMKKVSRGGVNPINPTEKLNIWIVNEISDGILGFATFPGGNPAVDGVVIGHNFFGKRGNVTAPFHKGRTATHEVGHWMNLRHIWGDGGCGVDDGVADTPLSDSPNYGCPEFPTVKCDVTNLTMNYMDYTNDRCMYMFTNGQRLRMRAIFKEGGPRASF